MTLNTNQSRAWAPDLRAFLPSEVVPQALIFRGATVVTQALEGDGPVARIPWVDDAAAEFVAEGDTIDEAEPTLAEVNVATGKIAQLVPISREQWIQDETGNLLSESVRRAIIKRANRAFISQAAPSAGNITPPEGIASQAGIEIETPITADLDPLITAVGTVESLGGKPNLILASPEAWAELRTIKTGTGSAQTLLGAGTSDAEKRLLGLEVITDAAVPAGSLIVLDSTAIAAAVGPVQVSTSEHVYFESDRIALRATWRIGWAVQHADRIATIQVGETTP